MIKKFWVLLDDPNFKLEEQITTFLLIVALLFFAGFALSGLWHLKNIPDALIRIGFGSAGTIGFGVLVISHRIRNSSTTAKEIGDKCVETCMSLVDGEQNND